MRRRARGVSEAALTTPGVEMAPPDRLVELALEHDRMVYQVRFQASPKR